MLQMMPEDMPADYSCHKGKDDEWKVPDVLGYCQIGFRVEREIFANDEIIQSDSQSAYQSCNKSYSSSE